MLLVQVPLSVLVCSLLSTKRTSCAVQQMAQSLKAKSVSLCPQCQNQ